MSSVICIEMNVKLSNVAMLLFLGESVLKNKKEPSFGFIKIKIMRGQNTSLSH